MKFGRCFFIGFLVLCSTLAACSWRENINKTRYTVIEGVVLDSLYTDFMNTDLRGIKEVLLRRTGLPPRPFGDMITVVRMTELKLIAYNKEYGHDNPTFKQLLLPDDYDYIFKDRPEKAESVSVEEVPTEANVNQEFLKVERIETLLEQSKNCNGATEMIRQRLRENRFLSLQDESDIVKEITYCRTVELMNNVK